MADVPYQNAAQVEQLLAERETAEAYGQKTRIEAADKALASFGITTKSDRNAAGKARREALEAEAEAADERVEDAHQTATAPAGRSTPKKATAAKKSAKKSASK